MRQLAAERTSMANRTHERKQRAPSIEPLRRHCSSSIHDSRPAEPALTYNVFHGKKVEEEIKEALEKLREDRSAQSPTDSDYVSKPLEAKKPNKNRIRKQGI